MVKLRLWAVLVVSACALAGCDTAKKQFGLLKEAPDEFAVVPRAPLSLPPSYALKPPRPGAVRPQEGTTATHARVAVFGQATNPAGIAVSDSNGLVVTDDQGKTAGENAMLRLAGADRAAPDIRALVDQESVILYGTGTDENFLRKLLTDEEPPPPGTVINARAEADRLRGTGQGNQPPAADSPAPETR